LVEQGYSAFGDWDTTTVGYGLKWSTASRGDKMNFIKSPYHNIFFDPEKGLCQVRYRIRVVRGMQGIWTVGKNEYTFNNGNSTSGLFQYDAYPMGTIAGQLAAQGRTVTPSVLKQYVSADSANTTIPGRYVSYRLNSSSHSGTSGKVSKNILLPYNPITTDQFGLDNQCFMIPIC
jgi:hypothetical protein